MEGFSTSMCSDPAMIWSDLSKPTILCNFCFIVVVIFLDFLFIFLVVLFLYFFSIFLVVFRYFLGHFSGAVVLVIFSIFCWLFSSDFPSILAVSVMLPALKTKFWAHNSMFSTDVVFSIGCFLSITNPTTLLMVGVTHRCLTLRNFLSIYR